MKKSIFALLALLCIIIACSPEEEKLDYRFLQTSEQVPTYIIPAFTSQIPTHASRNVVIEKYQDPDVWQITWEEHNGNGWIYSKYEGHSMICKIKLLDNGNIDFVPVAEY